MQVLAVKVTTHSTGSGSPRCCAEVAERTAVCRCRSSDHGGDLHQGITLFRREQTTDCVKPMIFRTASPPCSRPICSPTRWQTFLAHCKRTLASLSANRPAFLLPASSSEARVHARRHPCQWAAKPARLPGRGDFSAVRPTCRSDGRRQDHLRDRLGVARVRPLHVLLGHRSRQAAFCEAIRAASDLQLTDLDDAFWDPRRHRPRPLSWRASAGRVPIASLAIYAQMMEQSRPSERSQVRDCTRRLRIASNPHSLRAHRARSAEAAALPTGSWNRSVQPPRSRPAQHWLASSDIIESVFGKYKTFTARGPSRRSAGWCWRFRLPHRS